MTVTVRLYHSTEERRALLAWEFVTRGLDLLRQASAIHDRQRGRCYLCVRPFVHANPRGRGSTPKIRTRDHVFPRAMGGKGDANILLAHDDCNQAKGDRWPTPCEVIYLAAIYLPPLGALAIAMRRARLAAA